MISRQKKIVLLLLLITLTWGIHPASSAEKKGRFYYESRGEIVWEVPTNQKVICLTFDDGPDPKYTPEILKLLGKYQAKGTFFVTGNKVEQHPEIVLQQVLEGHEIANHSYSHRYISKMSSKELEEEILKTENIIKQVTGQVPKLYRPPGGFYNETVVNAAKGNGYTVVLWSWRHDTKDWANPGVDKIIKKVVKNAQNGDIVLFHDHGGNRKQTINALKEILPQLQKRGYRFITVSDLLNIKMDKIQQQK
ncbi:polysaccharide deacetylase family protein [Ammoniphilus resinae]|uniref:Polysaccharide deacetylase family sporulation protein PdaB n=1 Tax=Ammoniphilus resinae TaxID=861532 RepID=A0ABS4GIN0_9BACL|nr:polysaccharide deacetylase family protein [Ammoniphilus resinae]MBP1930107.1 polysaccharide deacetylase family sporulation protein PdaB [Ammoniphilus resinae]